MAAPTKVRVEASSPTSVVIRWAYSGTHSIGVYRSTDGVSYSLVGDPVPVGTRRFTDEDLTTETKYWYKVSDDEGATFSSVVTVYTHACGTANSSPNNTSFDRLTGDKEIPIGHLKKVINDMQRKIENWIGRRENPPSNACLGCITDGAIIFDCTDCDEFEVNITEDVNSISYINCNEEPTVHWQCPSDFAVAEGCGICGFPSGGMFSGDECTQAKIPTGRTMTSGPKPPRSKPGGNTGGGGTGGGGGVGGRDCECTPTRSNSLTIKCCGSSSCSLDCDGIKQLSVMVCGGKGPYNVSVTGSVVVKRLSGATVTSTTDVEAGDTIVLTPPTNSGGGFTDTAYIIKYYECFQSCVAGACPSGALSSFGHDDYGCTDDLKAACVANAAGHTHCDPTNPGGAAAKCHTSVSQCLPQCTGSSCNSDRVKAACDDRSAAMIAGGCNPCGVSAAGKVITVTDALGNSVARTLGV